MSDDSVKAGSGSFIGLWMIMFIVIKVGGTQLAAWSWWWLLLPIVPDLVIILRHFGLL